MACSADPPNLTIDRTGDVSIAQLASRARRIKRQKNTQLIVVDYLQLVTGLKKEGREQEVAGIVAKLKALAKELEVPVVALCQLSRKVESHPDYRPQLGDLRESGAIEHHADLVVFIYRRGYYLEREGENSPLVKQHTDEKGVPRESRLTAWTRDMNEWANKAELIVDKRRRGPRGSAFVTFDPERSRFFNLAPDGMAKQADDFARRQGAHTTTRSSRANGPERPIRQDIDG